MLRTSLALLIMYITADGWEYTHECRVLSLTIDKRPSDGQQHFIPAHDLTTNKAVRLRCDCGIIYSAGCTFLEVNHVYPCTQNGDVMWLERNRGYHPKNMQHSDCALFIVAGFVVFGEIVMFLLRKKWTDPID